MDVEGTNSSHPPPTGGKAHPPAEVHPHPASLRLPSITTLSLSDPCDRFPLSQFQHNSIEKLALLWAKIMEQATALSLRNTPVISALPSQVRDTLAKPLPPFLAPWTTYAHVLEALKHGNNSDTAEYRTILNGLHELSIIASLLASYGSQSFLMRAGNQLASIARNDPSLHTHVKRLYRHPYTLQAINIQLVAAGKESLTPQHITSPSHMNSLLRGLTGPCEKGQRRHAKEDALIERISTLLSVNSEEPSPIIIATSPTHAPLLALRLQKLLPSPIRELVSHMAPERIRQSQHDQSHSQRVSIIATLDLPHLTTETSAHIIIYSPAHIDGPKLCSLSSQTLEDIRSLFPNSKLAVLRSHSPLYALDDYLYEQALSAITVTTPPSPALPALTNETAGPPIGAQITSSAQLVPTANLLITIPQPQQKYLFDQTTLDTFQKPRNPKLIPKPIPTIDPATLPKDISELNSRIGTTLLKATFVPRQDQLALLFTMIQEGSFEWLVKAPTGWGKTPLAATVQAVILGKSPLCPTECQRGFRIGHVVPRVGLCAQTKKELLKFLDLQNHEIEVLNGTTSKTTRRKAFESDTNKTIIATPETFLKAIEGAPAHRGFDSLSLLIVDEYQTAEGDHAMAKLIRAAVKAKVPILALSGTPARDDQDRQDKRNIAPLKGNLNPQALIPLKNHELVKSYIDPEAMLLVRQLSDMTYGSYIDARNCIENGERFYNQAMGLETGTLFDFRTTIKRKPHLVSYTAPSAKRSEELKEQTSGIRENINRARQDRKAKGLPTSDGLEQARHEVSKASLAIAEIGSISASLSPLISGGRFPFLYDIAETWIARYLESERRVGNLPLYQEYMKKPVYRGILRCLATGTPFSHILQASSGPDLLKRAFALPNTLIPDTAAKRQSLFLNLAMNEMAMAGGIEHEKERKLFDRIEELRHRGEARGILIFAEPRNLTRYLALRLHYRFRPLGLRTAFTTGDGDGFADILAEHLTALKTGQPTGRGTPLSHFEDVRAAFQSTSSDPNQRADIIVSTSKLDVGINLSAATEAHIYTMHADAQKLIQEVGRVGRPDGENFFGRVGQCYYHVNRNSAEWYLFRSAVRKYTWMKEAFAQSERWEEPTEEG